MIFYSLLLHRLPPLLQTELALLGFLQHKMHFDLTHMIDLKDQ